MLALSLFVVAMPLPPRASPPADPGRPLPDRRCLRADLQRGCASCSPTRSPRPRRWTIRADKLTVWLLDDGGTDAEAQLRQGRRTPTPRRTRHAELQALCADLGVNYLTRERNEHAKAGNLNNGLAHSTGELVAVFDADHAPARDFLQETVGYFARGSEAVPGADAALLPQSRSARAQPAHLRAACRRENEMFYGIIQRGLDKWNAAFFCGSAAVLRREALDDDRAASPASASPRIARPRSSCIPRGWNSVYVDKPLIAGLQPATFASFIGQRTPLGAGHDADPALPLPAVQARPDICRSGSATCRSTLFWLFPFPRMIFLFAPLFYLFFDAGDLHRLGRRVHRLHADLHGREPDDAELSLRRASAGRGSPSSTNMSRSVHLLPAVVSVILNPRKPTFKVTAKDEIARQEPPVGARPAVLHDLRRAARRRRR